MHRELSKTSQELFLLACSAGRAALGELRSSRLLLLGKSLLHKGSVGGLLELGVLKSGLGLGHTNSLTGKSDRGDQALDLGSLGHGLAVLLKGAGNHELSQIIGLLEVKKSTDLGSTLGAEAAGGADVSHIGDLGIALLLDHEVEDGDVGAHNAAADGLALAGTHTAGSVAGKAVAEEKADASVGEYTLLHGEALLVITTGDAEDLSN
jgi:hypothetical protein